MLNITIDSLLKNEYSISDIFEIKLLITSFANELIRNGECAEFQAIYNYLKEININIDLECASILYQDTFDLSSDDYTEESILLEQSGECFRDILRYICESITYQNCLDENGLAEQFVNTVSQLFNHPFIDTYGIESPMKGIREFFKKSIINLLNCKYENTKQNYLPNILNRSMKFEMINKFNNRNESIEYILLNLFNSNKNISFISLFITIEDLISEFKIVMQEYIDGITDHANQILYETHLNDVIYSIYWLFFSIKENNSFIKNILYDAGYDIIVNGSPVLNWAKLSGYSKNGDILIENVKEVFNQDFTKNQTVILADYFLKEIENLRAKQLYHSIKESSILVENPNFLLLKKFVRLYNYGAFDISLIKLKLKLQLQLVGANEDDLNALSAILHR